MDIVWVRMVIRDSSWYETGKEAIVTENLPLSRVPVSGESILLQDKRWLVDSVEHVPLTSSAESCPTTLVVTLIRTYNQSDKSDGGRYRDAEFARKIPS